MKDILRQLKPKRFEDLIALNALYRPGPLDAKMIPKYIARAHGREDASVPLKEVEPILKETLGVIVYQEQVMLIAHRVAGFTLGQADILRKAMSKKDAAAMQVQRELFLEGCAERKVDPKKAAELFDNMETFGRYGFNKSHSAAYALVAFQTAYLKAHFPTHFMAATLSVLANNTDEVLKYMNSCREMGITLLPPDVNLSEEGFTIEGDAVRYGLGAIKNVGQASVEAILQARRRVGPFKDLFHFCREVDRFHVNRRVLENLVQSGAMDGFGQHRWDLVASLDGAMSSAARDQEDKARGQTALFGGEGWQEPAPQYLKGDPWRDLDKFSKEKESLGFYLSGHPLMEQEDVLRRYATHSLVGPGAPPRRLGGDRGRRGDFVAPEEEQEQGGDVRHHGPGGPGGPGGGHALHQGRRLQALSRGHREGRGGARGGQGGPRRLGHRRTEGQGQGHREHGRPLRQGRPGAGAEGHGRGPVRARAPLRGGVAHGAGRHAQAAPRSAARVPRRVGAGAGRFPYHAREPLPRPGRASPCSRTWRACSARDGSSSCSARATAAVGTGERDP